jgi:hypothetical protein
MTTPLEQLGRAAGWVSAPIFALGSALRRSRVLHPVGELFEGSIEPGVAPDDLAPLAEALRGGALVRLSAALWKRRASRLPDVLGCAIRIYDGDAGDQDLLLATIRRPWTTGLAPLTTDVRDYLANDYFSVSPFALEGIAQRFYLRLRPLRRGGRGGTRRERLIAALDEGAVTFAIEASYRPRSQWREVATLRLDRFAAEDAARVTFDPFRTGRGIAPRGVIHALRHGPYAASQAMRKAIRRAR